MRIRPYEQRDAEQIVVLFYDSIHTVCAADYSQSQLDAWAPEIPDLAVWHKRMAQRTTLVAEEKGTLLGFAELEDGGNLHMFFVRHDAQRQGIGLRLFSKIKQRALDFDLNRMTTEASITARPFFTRQGFEVIRQNNIERRGVTLTNYSMLLQLLRTAGSTDKAKQDTVQTEPGEGGPLE